MRQKINRKGSQAVEFSLLLPIVMMVVVFFVELSHYQNIRQMSQAAVIATCGENYTEDIAAALPSCWECYAGLTEDSEFYYCEFYDEVEPIVGFIPDEMRAVEIRINTLAPKIEELRELMDRLEELSEETG